MISSLHPDRRRLLGQLARFVVSGAFVTALGVGVYALVALVLHWHPQLGNFLAYVIAVATGYFMLSAGPIAANRPSSGSTRIATAR